jgi:hypothetical protein
VFKESYVKIIVENIENPEILQKEIDKILKELEGS